MTVELTRVNAPTAADRDAIHRPLIAYNAAKAGPAHYQPLAIVFRDEAAATIGGLWCDSYYQWLFIELLFVPQHLRQQQVGTRLLAEAEVFARQNHCNGVWLDSFAFQAPRFYEKLGYQQFGCIDDYPKGFTRFFFSKRL